MQVHDHHYYSYRLVLTYFTFRIVLSLSLVTISLVDQEFSLSGQYQAPEFLATVTSYFILTLATQLYTLLQSSTPQNITLFFSILIDVLFCLVFMHLSGGFATGLGILLLSPIAIAGIFFYGAIAFSIAAISAIGMLLHVGYMFLQMPEQAKYFVPAGLLGVLFFAVSLVTQLIARYIRRTEQLAGFNIDLAEKLEQINQRIVQKMLTGIIVVDKQRKIQTINDSACQLTGRDMKPGQLLVGKVNEAFVSWQENNRQPAHNFQEKSGLPLLRASFSPVQSDGDTIIFLENQSVLTQQAQHMKLASLGRLSASIAHEIRNPLSTINHASQLLAESPAINDSDSRLLQMIQNHVTRLNDIVSNVLNISRRDPVKPGRVDIAVLIRQIIAQLNETRNIQITCSLQLQPDPFIVAFDECQLQQVLSNLIDNAVMHSAKQGNEHWVGIEAFIDHGLPVLFLYDRGSGIARADADKIFEPFYTTHAQGTGLGLYIARELCEMNQAVLDYVHEHKGRSGFMIRFAHIDRRLSVSEKDYGQ